MISCFQLKPCVKCFSNLFLKGFKLKKLVVEPKKWLNRLKNRSIGCSCLIEDQSRDAKKSLSPSGLFFPVEVILFPVEDQSKSD